MLLIRKPKSTLLRGGNKYEQTWSHHSRTLPETELDTEVVYGILGSQPGEHGRALESESAQS